MQETLRSEYPYYVYLKWDDKNLTERLQAFFVRNPEDIQEVLKNRGKDFMVKVVCAFGDYIISISP